ncbi:hypothetical protein SKAU_G00399460 [Synaphobranchus kaupii]|uniref:Uncharacterized protein n=1 Tax=Synaphobranchus kaupii TaxID=118154 RepID=A0A9Q1IC84_SYNKA|nr:hypothetical protein SKAU_G00399460 [Synaphobranchus kaupii]
MQLYPEPFLHNAARSSLHIRLHQHSITFTGESRERERVRRNICEHKLCDTQSRAYIQHSQSQHQGKWLWHKVKQRYYGDSSKWFKMCAEELLKRVRHYETPAPCGKDSARHCGQLRCAEPQNSHVNIGAPALMPNTSVILCCSSTPPG